MAEENNTAEQETAVTSNTIDLACLYGVKAGMTRIFDDNGNHIPVTVVKLIPNYITQVKTRDNDGYGAYQLVFMKNVKS